jgi:serine/threonine protein kinase
MQQPEYPLEEEFNPPLNPLIEPCISNPTINVLRDGTNQVQQTNAMVIGSRGLQAYKVVEWMHQVTLTRGGPVWGYVCFGSILPRIQGLPEGTIVFHQASEERVQVAIKRLDKQVFIPALNDPENPSSENPYREILRMQTPTLADNIYALGCIEALEDDRYLYIITPYCDGGDLNESTPLEPKNEVPAEVQAFVIYRKMLDILEHVHDTPHVRNEFGICHRDIKGANFLVADNDRLLLTDFAMSFPIPKNGFVNHIGTFGTPPFLPPEIARELPFNARACDLWACTVTLFNILTGLPLYYQPLPNDILFAFCIMAKGLSNDPVLEAVQQLFAESDETQTALLLRINQRIISLSPQLRQLLSNVLTLNPFERWTRQDVLSSEWMTMNLAIATQQGLI